MQRRWLSSLLTLLRTVSGSMVMASRKVLLVVRQISFLLLLTNAPLGRDPLQIARTMASRGIVLVSVGLRILVQLAD